MNVRLGSFLKAGGSDFEIIFADGERIRCVDPAAIRMEGFGFTGLGVAHGDFGARHAASARVGDSAGDHAGGLGVQRATGTKQSAGPQGDLPGQGIDDGHGFLLRGKPWAFEEAAGCRGLRDFVRCHARRAL